MCGKSLIFSSLQTKIFTWKTNDKNYNFLIPFFLFHRNTQLTKLSIQKTINKVLIYYALAALTFKPQPQFYQQESRQQYSEFEIMFLTPPGKFEFTVFRLLSWVQMSKT